MSRPKVVRVVTREELVAAGTTLLARLDAAAQQWQRDCGGPVKIPVICAWTHSPLLYTRRRMTRWPR